MKRASFALLFLLVGCVTAQPIYTGDRMAYLLDCSGLVTQTSKCFDQANKACPHGFDIDNDKVGTLREGQIIVTCKDGEWEKRKPLNVPVL